MIHREGIKISFLVFMVLAIANVLVFILSGPCIWTACFLVVSFCFMVFILRFFRDPGRKASYNEGLIYSPADGKVVVVEKCSEDEFLMDRRIQVSVFMSVWNVHINWYPVGGLLSYYKYHPGKYLLARHPKSSTLNERNTVVIRTDGGSEILVRQIAGTVARRIISHAKVGEKVRGGDELGFIRFGSRVDVFLPLNSKILVRPGQKVRGTKTPLAELN
jgi:phosphatidylserine decarboxylase